VEQHSKKNKVIKLIITFFVTLLILLFLSWFYIFNIYEVKILLLQSSSLNYELELIPLNSLGLNAPMRNVEFSYKIIDGKDNIGIISETDNLIKIKLINNNTPVKLEITTNRTQNIFLVEIPNHKTE